MSDPHAQTKAPETEESTGVVAGKLVVGAVVGAVVGFVGGTALFDSYVVGCLGVLGGALGAVLGGGMSMEGEAAPNFNQPD